MSGQADIILTISSINRGVDGGRVETRRSREGLFVLTRDGGRKEGAGERGVQEIEGWEEETPV